MQAGTERPRFRQDLFAEAIDEQGAKFIDVMDPDSGKVFRFYEVEFSIACAMDGERDVPGLVKWAQDELGVTPTTGEVQTVIATLGELGYLDMTAATKAGASDVAAAPGLASGAGKPEDAVAEAPALKVPAARPPVEVERPSARMPAVAATSAPVSDVSLDLSEHLAVGREDVQEAVRQSRVMAAVEMPPELAEPAARPTPTPPARPVATPAERPSRPLPAQAKQPEPPAPVRQPEPPVEARQPEPVIEAKQPEPVAPVTQPEPVVPVTQPEPVIEAKQPEPVIEAKQPERRAPVKQPETQKAPIELPKVPEKQPVPPPAPARRLSPVIIVLILVLLGGGAFLVWKLVLNKSSQPAEPVSVAPVMPQPPPAPPAEPPPPPSVTAKIEISSGRPKTILAYFAGTIEWIETSGKEVKSNDVIVKMRGHKALEAQVAAMTKEVAKFQADVSAAHKARDAVPAGDEAALKKAQAKVDALEKLATAKSDQLDKKTDELEKLYVRLTLDGTLTVTRKVGDKLPENTPVATLVPAPAPSATFQIPQGMKLEIGTATALRLGEKILTCEVADWEPEKLRMTCPAEPGVVEGATVSWQLP